MTVKQDCRPGRRLLTRNLLTSLANMPDTAREPDPVTWKTKNAWNPGRVAAPLSQLTVTFPLSRARTAGIGYSREPTDGDGVGRAAGCACGAGRPRYAPTPRPRTATRAATPTRSQRRFFGGTGSARPARTRRSETRVATRSPLVDTATPPWGGNRPRYRDWAARGAKRVGAP